MKQYLLHVSENQARIIMVSLEEYFRTRLGQFSTLSDDIAFNGYDPDNRDKEGADNDWHHRINYRNDAEELFNKAFEMAKPKYRSANEYYQKTPDMRNAIDIWHVIRHQFWKDRPNHSDWTTDSIEPFAIAGEPLCKIERIEGDMGNGK